MAYRRLPNSVPAVLRTFQTAADQYRATTRPADRAIGAELFAVIDDRDPASLHSRLRKEASDVDVAQAKQSPLTTTLSKNAARLTMFDSHYHQGLDNGILRGAFAPGARSYYGRDAGATTLPDLGSYDAVAEAADAIVKGEAKRAEAEGAAFVPMSNPSAAEVGSVLAIFRADRAASKATQQHTDEQSEEMMALYPEARRVAEDLCDTVEFFYRADKVDGSRRQKCQRWGVVYVFEAEDKTASTTPPDAGTTEPA